MNGFVLAGVAIAAFAAGAALVSFRYERELRRMARFLDQREPTGNARMTASVRTRGVLGIARGVNAELDELQNERIASQQARQAFQAGLTCLSHDIRTPLAGAQGYLQLVEDEADPAAKERYLSAAAHRLDDVRVLLDDLFSFAQVHDPSFEVAYECVRPTCWETCWPGCTRSSASGAGSRACCWTTRRSCRPMPRRSRASSAT